MTALLPKTIMHGNPPSPSHRVNPADMADWMQAQESIAAGEFIKYIDGAVDNLRARIGPVDGEFGLVITTAAERGIYELVNGTWIKRTDIPAIFAESLAAKEALASAEGAEEHKQAAATSAGEAAASEASSSANAATATTKAAQAVLAAQAAGATLYADEATGLAASSDGDVFLVQEMPGVAVFQRVAAASVHIGWLGELIYDDVPSLKAASHFFAVNTIVRTRLEGFSYKVVASGWQIENAGGVRFEITPIVGTVTPAMWGDTSADFEAALQYMVQAGKMIVIDRDYELDGPITIDCQLNPLRMDFRNGAMITPVTSMTPDEHLLRFDNTGDLAMTGVGGVDGLELVAVPLWIENEALANKALIDRHITVRGGRRRAGMNNEGTSLRLAGGWHSASIEGSVIEQASYDAGAGIESVKGCACLTVATTGDGAHYIRALHIEAVFGSQAIGGDLIDADVVKVLSSKTEVFIGRLEVGAHTGRAVKLQSARTTIDYASIKRSGVVQANYTCVDQQTGDSLVINRVHVEYLDGAVPSASEKLFHLTVRPGVGRAEIVIKDATVDLAGIDDAAAEPADRIMALASLGHEDLAGVDIGVMRLERIVTKNGLLRRLVHLNLSTAAVDEVYIRGARLENLASELIYINNGGPENLSGHVEDVRRYSGALVPVVQWGVASGEKPRMTGRDLVGFNDPLATPSATEARPVEISRMWRRGFNEGSFHTGGDVTFSDGEYHDVVTGAYWVGAMMLTVNSDAFPASGIVQVRDGTTEIKICGEAGLYTGAPGGGDPAGIYVEAVSGGARIHCHNTGGSRRLSYTT